MEPSASVVAPAGAALHIVGIGGTLRANSSTELALRLALQTAQRAGATTQLLTGEHLNLPIYAPGNAERVTAARRMIEEMRRADGVILASPGYHGSISGLVKNALDYVEDMRTDPLPYFEDRAVGCIVTASGWQAAVSTLAALRSVAHALRGWPTPLGVAINTVECGFDADGNCRSRHVQGQIECMVEQVLGFRRRSK